MAKKKDAKAAGDTGSGAVEWPLLGMTVEETARALRVSPRYVREALRDGELPGAWIANKWRVSPQAILRMMDTYEDAPKARANSTPEPEKNGQR